MMPDRTTLKARHVTLSYGKGETLTTALRDVCLDLHRGQMTLLMGPSGSGKSSLLSVLSGLQRPDSGKISVFGEDLWALSDRDRERFRLKHFGFIFQGYNLFPALTPAAAELVRPKRGLPTRRSQRVRDICLALTGTGQAECGQRSSPVAKQRALSPASSCAPLYFCFADEPTSC